MKGSAQIDHAGSSLLIFVAGPYSDASEERRRLNVRRIHQTVKDLILKGHAILECHSLEHALYADPDLSHAHFLAQTLTWLSRCDAMFFVASSPGADLELARAESLGMPIFRSLEDVPTSGTMTNQVHTISELLAGNRQ
jgi:hypothetical protein